MYFAACRQPTYGKNEAVVSYHDSCEGQLRTLTAQSMETVFVPFVEYVKQLTLHNVCWTYPFMNRGDLVLPWGGIQKTAVELLCLFLTNVYKRCHIEGICKSNSNVESFGISLIAGVVACSFPCVNLLSYNSCCCLFVCSGDVSALAATLGEACCLLEVFHKGEVVLGSNHSFLVSDCFN